MLDLEGHHYSHLHLMPWVEHQLHNSSSVASPRKRSQRKVRRENQRELIKENEEMKNEVLKYLDKNNDLEGHYYSHLHLMPWVEHQLHNSSSVASVFSGFDWLEQAVYVDSTVLFSMYKSLHPLRLRPPHQRSLFD
jgi:hypothetical protein